MARPGPDHVGPSPMAKSGLADPFVGPRSEGRSATEHAFVVAGYMAEPDALSPAGSPLVSVPRPRSGPSRCAQCPRDRPASWRARRLAAGEADAISFRSRRAETPWLAARERASPGGSLDMRLTHAHWGAAVEPASSGPSPARLGFCLVATRRLSTSRELPSEKVSALRSPRGLTPRRRLPVWRRRPVLAHPTEPCPAS